jgi:hypothetical protein
MTPPSFAASIVLTLQAQHVCCFSHPQGYAMMAQTRAGKA